MKLSQETINQVKQIPINKVLADSGIVIKNKRCSCIAPNHNDRHPSASIYVKHNILHCFSCNRSWDTIEVYRELFNMSFVEAVERLSTNYGIVACTSTDRYIPQVKRDDTDDRIVVDVFRYFRNGNHPDRLEVLDKLEELGVSDEATEYCKMLIKKYNLKF